MARPASPMSTTAHSRLTPSLPQKPYEVLRFLYGDARTLNALARALVLQYLVEQLPGELFLTEDEIDQMKGWMVLPDLQTPKDWAALAAQFNSQQEPVVQ